MYFVEHNYGIFIQLLVWNENTYKILVHQKQVFQNKYSNLKSENFCFLLLKMISELLSTFTNGRGETTTI
jgi:DNA-directed RNA polymerase subunit E'/Rpb7